MSHSIHTTRGYILEVIPVGEADKDVIIATESHGILRMRLAGNRKITSKMRMHVERFAEVTVSMVEGRIWRVTGLSKNNSSPFWQHDVLITVMHRISKMIIKLHQGQQEDAHIVELFDLIIATDIKLILDHVSCFEIWCMISVLRIYGYWDDESFIIAEIINPDVLDYIEQHKKQLIAQINTALHDSQLVHTR